MNNSNIEPTEAVLKIARVLKELLPTIIGDNTPELDNYQDETILEYEVVGEHTVDEAIITMTIDADMCMLYRSVCKSNNKRHVCMAYRPEGCYMYKVNFITDESEQLQSITVTVYESITDFVTAIDYDLTNHTREDFEVLDMISEEKYEEITGS